MLLELELEEIKRKIEILTRKLGNVKKYLEETEK